MLKFRLKMFAMILLATYTAGCDAPNQPVAQRYDQKEVVKPPVEEIPVQAGKPLEEKIPSHVTKALEEKIPLNFESVPVEDVLKFVHSSTAGAGFEGLEFALDLIRPGKLGRSGPHLATIHSENESLRVALGRLLEPLDLHLVVTDRVVLITAKGVNNSPK